MRHGHLLPDAARLAVDLVDCADDFACYEEFHYGGHQITGSEMVESLRDALDAPDLRVAKFPWWLLWLASPFSLRV